MTNEYYTKVIQKKFKTLGDTHMRNYRKELYNFKKTCMPIHTPKPNFDASNYSLIFESSFFFSDFKKNILIYCNQSTNEINKLVENFNTYFHNYLYSLSICLEKIDSPAPTSTKIIDSLGKPLLAETSIQATIGISSSHRTHSTSFQLAASSLNKSFVKQIPNPYVSSSKRRDFSSENFSYIRSRSTYLQCDELFFNIVWILLHNANTMPFTLPLSSDISCPQSHGDLITQCIDLKLFDIAVLNKDTQKELFRTAGAFFPQLYNSSKNPTCHIHPDEGRKSIRKFYYNPYRDLSSYYSLSTTFNTTSLDTSQKIFDYFILETILNSSCFINFFNTFSSHQGTYITQKLGLEKIIELYQIICSIKNFFLKPTLISLIFKSYTNDYIFQNAQYPPGLKDLETWFNNVKRSLLYIANTYEPKLIKTFFSTFYSTIPTPHFTSEELTDIFKSYTDLLTSIGLYKEEVPLKEIKTSAQKSLFDNLVLAYADYSRKN